MGRHVRINPNHPQAAAVCDRCGDWRQHVDLSWQMRWAGQRIINLGLLVCRECLDPLDPGDRTKILPPDGLPIRDPRPEPMSGVIYNELVTELGAPLTDESGNLLIVNDVVP